MNSENQVVEIINTLADKFGIVIDWSNKNVLPYVQELIHRFAMYNIIKGILELVLSIIISIISSSIVKKAYKRLLDYESEDKEFDDLLVIVFGILFISFIIFIPFEVKEILKSILLPELSFLEYIREIR